MSRRDQIRMSDEEVAAFLDEEQTVVCATNGRDGWPHLMALWYVLRDATVFRDTERVADLGADILARYGPDVELTGEVRAIVARQASKRVGLEFRETDRATWDHRKLGAGTY